MIEGEVVMTAREELHKLVDSLPEERIADVLDYNEDLDGLSPETQAAIREGRDDIEHGRVMTLEEYRRTRGL